MGLEQVIDPLGTAQHLGAGIQQPTHRRVGKTDHPCLVDHQNAFGNIGQHRGIEGACDFQLVDQGLQGTEVALMLQQYLNLGLENVRIEGFEQEIHSTTGVALVDSRLGLFIGSQENDRRQSRALTATHEASDFETIHAGHVHIEQDQVDIQFQQEIQGLHPGAGRDHMPVLTLQDRTHGD